MVSKDRQICLQERPAPGADRNGLSRVNRPDREAGRSTVGTTEIAWQAASALAANKRHGSGATQKSAWSDQEAKVGHMGWRARPRARAAPVYAARGSRRLSTSAFRKGEEGTPAATPASVSVSCSISPKVCAVRCAPAIYCGTRQQRPLGRPAPRGVESTPDKSIDRFERQKGPAVWPGVQEREGGTTCRVQDGIPETAPGCCHASPRSHIAECDRKDCSHGFFQRVRLARHRGRLTLGRTQATRASCTTASKHRHFSLPTNARRAAFIETPKHADNEPVHAAPPLFVSHFKLW